MFTSSRKVNAGGPATHDLIYTGSHFKLDLEYNPRTGRTIRTWVIKSESVFEDDRHLYQPQSVSTGENVRSTSLSYIPNVLPS